MIDVNSAQYQPAPGDTKYLLCSRNISSAKMKMMSMRIPPTVPNSQFQSTYAQSVWEAAAAVNGTDIGEPNSPTGTQIRSTAAARYCHANVPHTERQVRHNQ